MVNSGTPGMSGLNVLQGLLQKIPWTVRDVRNLFKPAVGTTAATPLIVATNPVARVTGTAHVDGTASGTSCENSTTFKIIVYLFSGGFIIAGFVYLHYMPGAPLCGYNTNTTCPPPHGGAIPLVV